MKRVLWMDSGMITQQSKCTYCHWNVYLTMVCYCSVAQSWQTLCDSMDLSMPDFPVLHHLLDFAQTLVLWVGDAITILFSVVSFSSCLQSFPASGFFLMSRLLASGGQSVGASASASFLSMNIQDWFPLGLTSLISLQSKRLSRVFSNTRAQKQQFFRLPWWLRG